MYKRILIVTATKQELPRIKGDVIRAIIGIGKVSAKRGIKRSVEAHRPDLVISIGLAGAVTEDLQPGDIVIPEAIIDYENIHKKYSIDFPINKSGTVVTVPKIFLEPYKLKLKETLPEATIVDMESSAIAEVLSLLGIPLLCIKAVLDDLNFKFPDLNLLLGRKKSWWLVLIRPYNIWRLVKLRDNMKKAVGAYTKFLWKLLSEIQE